MTEQQVVRKQHSVQKGSSLEFYCVSCGHAIEFSVLSISREEDMVTCGHCGKQYSFADETISRQLKKFEALCRQIRESEEILGATAVSIDVGTHNVKIPYKLLLTRLNSELTLTMNNQEITISFRIEPSKDSPEESKDQF